MGQLYVERPPVGNGILAVFGPVETAWNLFDLMPQGRGIDWHEQLDYADTRTSHPQYKNHVRNNDTNPPKIGEAHERLEVFVGKWHTKGTSFSEGQTPDNPRASGVPWTSDEHYEWLPGGFFLLHQWDALAGTKVQRNRNHRA